jgi:hypothetical protein
MKIFCIRLFFGWLILLFYSSMPMPLHLNILALNNIFICRQPYVEHLLTYWAHLLNIYETPGTVLKNSVWVMYSYSGFIAKEDNNYQNQRMYQIISMTLELNKGNSEMNHEVNSFLCGKQYPCTSLYPALNYYL